MTKKLCPLLFVPQNISFNKKFNQYRRLFFCLKMNIFKHNCFRLGMKEFNNKKKKIEQGNQIQQHNNKKNV